MLIPCLQLEIDPGKKLPLRSKKPNQQIHFRLHGNRCLFMWGAAYKCDVVVVIQMGAYIHGSLFCVGAYYPDFTVRGPNTVISNTAASFKMIWKCIGCIHIDFIKWR